MESYEAEIYRLCNRRSRLSNHAPDGGIRPCKQCRSETVIGLRKLVDELEKKQELQELQEQQASKIKIVG